jgi:hypothetical protein
MTIREDFTSQNTTEPEPIPVNVADTAFTILRFRHHSSVGMEHVEGSLVPLAHGTVRRQRSPGKIRRNPLTSTIQSGIGESRGVACAVDDQYGRIWKRFGHRESTENFGKLKKRCRQLAENDAVGGEMEDVWEGILAQRCGRIGCVSYEENRFLRKNIFKSPC